MWNKQMSFNALLFMILCLYLFKLQLSCYVLLLELHLSCSCLEYYDPSYQCFTIFWSRLWWCMSPVTYKISSSSKPSYCIHRIMACLLCTKTFKAKTLIKPYLKPLFYYMYGAWFYFILWHQIVFGVIRCVWHTFGH